MAFDGRDYLDPGWCWQRAGEPINQANGVVPATALEGAYYQARHGAKHLGSVMAGYNSVNFVRNDVRGIIPKRGAYVGVTDFLIDIPSTATHLVAGITFAAGADQELTVSHRLTLQGTTGSDDVGAASTVAIANGSAGSLITPTLWREVENPVLTDIGRRQEIRPALFPQARLTWCEVELANQVWSDGSANQIGCLVLLEVKLDTDSATTVGYRPGAVWLGYEVRDG